MGRRRRHHRHSLLLLWALLGLLRPGAAEPQGLHHTYENVKLLQVSMHPTAAVQISSKEEESPKDQDSKVVEKAEAKEEEKMLDGLVGALLNMVKNIPTAKAEILVHSIPLSTVPLQTEPPVVMTTVLKSSQSETVEAARVSSTPTAVVEKAESSQTVVLTHQIAPTSSTPVWEVLNVTSEPVILQTDETTTAKPLVSVSLLIEKATTQKSMKNFDKMTNGALSNLEQALENVNKLNGILDNFTQATVDQENQNEKEHEKKPTAEDILGLIEKLIETLKSTPSFVKEDRNLYKYIQTAETYIKDALDLAGKAEKKLQQENPVSPFTPARKKKVPLVPIPEPLPVPTVTVQSVSPPPVPLAKKAEEAQVEMGKLKAFVNLLYGFSPHLTTYTQNTAHEKVAEDIVERALAVLHAIKSVFCGSKEAQSKQALKQLLKEDMALVNQAMKAKRVS